MLAHMYSFYSVSWQLNTHFIILHVSSMWAFKLWRFTQAQCGYSHYDALFNLNHCYSHFIIPPVGSMRVFALYRYVHAQSSLCSFYRSVCRVNTGIRYITFCTSSVIAISNLSFHLSAQCAHLHYNVMCMLNHRYAHFIILPVSSMWIFVLWRFMQA